MMDPGMAAELIEEAPDGLVVVDADGIVQWVNRRTTDMFGYGDDDLVGLPVEVLLPEALRSAHVQHRLRFLERPVARPMGQGVRLRGRRKGGAEFPVESSLSFFVRRGKSVVVAAVRDESERRLVERELAAEREHTATLLESLDEGFMEVDVTGKIVDTNARFCELVGLAPDAVIGAEPPYPWWPPESFDEHAALWRRLLEGGGGYEGLKCKERWVPNQRRGQLDGGRQVSWGA